MRTGVIQEIYNQMKASKDVYFLTGDLGYSVIEKIEADFPEQFINVGIAEQNMIGIAAGLALSGKKVYVYSIIPFAIMRCYEQIRNDLCYHNLDVTIIGAGAGLSYGILSSTHFALEDIAILRPLPHMSIFSPADEKEAIAGMKALAGKHGPVYVRMGKKVEPVIYNEELAFTWGKISVLQEGSDICIFSTGPIIDEVLKATKELKNNSIETTIIDVHTIKPIDIDSIKKHIQGKKLIVSIEEHYESGGLGSVISEISSSFESSRLLRIGVADHFIKETGTQEYLRSITGLTGAQLAATILKTL